ncbi:MAG: TIGR01777 family protein [Pirellulaceae bacterium]|nr:TIGR01777 family protein [Pirellulaceae bacterium]
MKVVLAGGSGQLGQILTRDFCRRGWQVVVLSRKETCHLPNLDTSFDNVRTCRWDGRSSDSWCRELADSDIVVNLAGRSVDCRYHQANRRLIVDSRVNSTRTLAQAIADCPTPPKLFLQSSTATIYSHRYDGTNDEVTGVIGGNEPNVPETWRFSIDVAKKWESAATSIDLPKTRRVLMRSAMVMSPDRGGVLDVLLRLVRLGLGGPNGNGKQFVSWIHDADFVAAIHWIIDHGQLDGAINLAAPGPLPNREFMRTLRHAWGRRFGLPANRAMLEIGAVFLRTETELILKSRRVVPTRLLDSGFDFQFSDWQSAARDLCTRYRSARR